MRILVDAHMVGSGETGNETYIVNLLSNLAQLPDVRCAAAVMPDASLPTALQNSDVELLPLHPSGNWMRLTYTLPAMCQSWQADLLHVTYVGPFLTSCPLVVSVHDVSFKRYPEFFSPRDRLLFASLLPFTLRRASTVITLSGHAQREIIALFPYLDHKVHAIPLAPGAWLRPIDEERDLLQKIRSHYRIRSEFILAVGNLQPRKNLPRLVRAFASIRADLDGCQLVIVGKAQWQSSEVYALVESLGLGKDVIFTGHVPDEDLLPLYNLATAFIYPSLYEGFGLPILEAMACGTPVITSQVASMPKVAGNAAILIDPHREEEIAEAIQQVVTDAYLAKSLSARGLAHIKQFSWARTAAETLAVYESVLKQQDSSSIGHSKV